MHLLRGLLGWLITISHGRWPVGYPVVADPDRSEQVRRVRLGEFSRLFSGASNGVPVAVALSVLIFFAYLVGGLRGWDAWHDSPARSRALPMWLWQIMALILGIPGDLPHASAGSRTVSRPCPCRS